MTFRILLGLMLILNACASQQPASKSGLKIEYKATRGQSYTDSLGTSYSLRHIPATITNDSTVPIHIQIAFSTEYDYPITYNDRKFKLFPMPEIWSLDGVDITDSILHELPKYIDNPFFSKTLKPGEKCLLAIGTLYPHPLNYGVFPVAVLSHDNRKLHHECKNLIDPNKLSIPSSELQLLIGFTAGSQASPDSCAVLAMGRISYPES